MVLFIGLFVWQKCPWNLHSVQAEENWNRRSLLMHLITVSKIWCKECFEFRIWYLRIHKATWVTVGNRSTPSIDVLKKWGMWLIDWLIDQQVGKKLRNTYWISLNLCWVVASFKILIHLKLLVSLCTSWKHQKTRGVMMRSGGIDRYQWHEMG